MNTKRIYETKDYSIFKLIKGNRDIKEKSTNRIKQSIKEKDLELPIIVNEKMEIIEGQHTFESRRDLKLVIYYIVRPGLTIDDVQRFNANRTAWKALDHVKLFCEKGIKDYLIFREFQAKNNFTIEVCIALLSGHATRYRDFSDGNFKIKDLKQAESIAESIHSMANLYAGYKRRSFVFAIMKSLNVKGFKLNEFIKKLEFQTVKMVHCTNVNQYLKLIEDIYNFKRTDKIRLF